MWMGSNAHSFYHSLFPKLFSMINHFYNQGGEKAIKITGSCKESRKFLKTAISQVLAVIVSRWWEGDCTQESSTLFCLFFWGGGGVESEFRAYLEFWHVVS